MRSTTCYSDARANQTLDQTAAIVQRYGESTRPPLISFTVRPQIREFAVTTTNRGMRAMGYATATSFFGCGTTLYGWRPAVPGHHVVTRWITVAFFPLVPLGSYTIDFMRDGRVGWDYVVSVFGVVRDSLEGEPTSSICWGQVINTYLYAYLPWAIALSCGRLVPDLLAWIIALLILSSWVFAAIKMRRAVR